MTGSNDPLLDQYIAVVKAIRNEWLRCTTPSGKPMRGPGWICIGRCTEEDGNQYGLISVNNKWYGVGERWACKTCLGFMEPVWWDGLIPDIENIREEWADWMAKKGRSIRTF